MVRHGRLNTPSVDAPVSSWRSSAQAKRSALEGASIADGGSLTYLRGFLSRLGAFGLPHLLLSVREHRADGCRTLRFGLFRLDFPLPTLVVWQTNSSSSTWCPPLLRRDPRFPCKVLPEASSSAAKSKVRQSAQAVELGFFVFDKAEVLS